MNTARIEALTWTYLTHELLNDALPTAVQVFDVRLSNNEVADEQYLVVCAHYPALDWSTREAIASYLLNRMPGAFVSFIVADTEGRAEVITTQECILTSPFRVAAAVAIVKASCGWDESNPVVVNVNETEESIHLDFDGLAWTAQSSSKVIE